MSDLTDFARQINDTLTDASRERQWTTQEAERYMADVAERRRRTDDVASRLTSVVILPRLRTLAGYFPNANISEDEPPCHHTCWFEYSERFPTTARITLRLEHDLQYERIAVCYEAYMVPMFVKFNEHDRLTSPLDIVDDMSVANWVERRLLEFLDAYLQIDSSGQDSGGETVTDPVCGMRIRRSDAPFHDSYCGHPYYFCCEDCRVKFQLDPTQYIQIKVM